MNAGTPFTLPKPMRLLVLTVLLIALASETTQAHPAQQRLERDVQMALRFWADRGVVGCPLGVTLTVVDLPEAGQGGFCQVRMSGYWLPPNRWAMSRDVECAVVFHEVRHALPGGTFGGFDGQGHTESGLMAVPVGAVPQECIGKRRPVKGPPKGVRR
jgi:hypothetical protein